MTKRDTGAGAVSGPLPISTIERTILGILGGATVAAATYPVAEKGYVDLFTKVDAALWVGFLVRLAGAAAIGGIWGFIHRPETDPRRAFQLGLVAPATIAGMIYANDVDEIGRKLSLGPSAVESVLAAGAKEFSLVAVAHAQTLPIPTVGPNSPSFLDRVIQGVLGK